MAKRLELLHQLVPTAVRVGVLVNPDNVGNTQTTLRDVETAARAIGLQIQVFNASSIGEIDAAFASLARARPDALFVGGDTVFNSDSGRSGTVPEQLFRSSADTHWMGIRAGLFTCTQRASSKVQSKLMNGVAVFGSKKSRHPCAVSGARHYQLAPRNHRLVERDNVPTV